MSHLSEDWSSTWGIYEWVKKSGAAEVETGSRSIALCRFALLSKTGNIGNGGLTRPSSSCTLWPLPAAYESGGR
jgi:hypothetical protein